MASDLGSGSELGGFRLERLIGAGGMGAVYLATDATLQRRVALKLVAPALADDVRYRERFLREAQLAASLDHPAIVPVFHAGESGGRVFLAMRYVEGGSLAERLARDRSLAPDEAAGLLGPIADALDTAHRAGLVHRDVKPANILLEGGRAFLADFGLARLTSSPDSLVGELGRSGTVGYLAPEQIEGDRVTAQTDQYALACVLFACLAGQGPFERSDELAVVYAHLSEPPPSLVHLRPELPRGVDGVLARGLAKRPTERYASCHDLVAAFAAASGAAAADAPPPRRRRARAALAVTAAVGIAAATAAVALIGGRGDGTAPIHGPPSDRSGIGLLDPRTGHLLATIPLAGRAPSNVAVGAGSIWVLDADDRTIARVDPKARSLVRTFSTASTPTDVAVGAGAVWIGNGFPETASFAGSGSPDTILRLDPRSVLEAGRITLPRTGGQYFTGGAIGQHIAVDRDAVWVVNPDQTVSRIDPRTRRVVQTVADVRANGIAAGDLGVWVVESGAVAQLDPTHGVRRRIEVAAESLAAVAVGANEIWVADPVGGSVWRVEPDPKPVLRQIPLAFGVHWIAATRQAVWATNAITDEVYRIDPRTNKAQVVSRIAAPGGIAVGEGGVWVTTAGQPSSAGPLPRSVCADVDTGGARTPNVMLVSDLPLQGPAGAATGAMVDAIRFVLQRHGFTAGRFSVGYQSCDDSTAQNGGFDLYRCALNAKAYTRRLDVVGVIGAYNSICSLAEIPVANVAPAGPLAMISPSNTFTGLTRPYRGMRAGDLEQLYPKGERNYVRIAAADHLSAVVEVELARRLRRKRVFVTWDGADSYMTGFAADMREAARRLGVGVVGAAAWNPDARRFNRLARTIAHRKPDAVLIAGAAPPRLDAFLRDLRAGLGPDVALIANDGFAPGGTSPQLAAGGTAAAGMYVIEFGLPDSELPPRGRRWLAEFLAARGGGPTPPLSAAYGAQAMEILLDAIARSDGTRSSVTRALRGTQIRDGILGDIRFDKFGDLVEGPVTVFRVVGNHAVVDRVLTAHSLSGA